MDNNLLEGLINDSFDRHYKLIQSLRNQYLSMIRLILKNKRQNNLTLEEILAYHDIEKKLLDVRKDISTLINNKYTNLTPPDDNDVKMVKTLKAFLPFMIAFYNAQHTIQEKEKQNKNKNQNQNQNQNLETATFIPVAPPLD
jgi:hypothetical protein